ncbi:MAG TPA: 50S ribosomal protein L9 [Bacillota bacterium]|jgi:large subunit ribosomal protein L9
MIVVLLKEIKALGHKGETVDVAEGYARNYLFPRGLASEAAGGTVRHFENEKKRLENRAEHEMEAAEEAAAKLKGLTLVLKAKAGEGGRLFGSVTSQDIVDGIAKETRLNIDRRRVVLAEAIKTLGAHDVQLRLHPKVGVTIKLVVEAAGKAV